MALIRWEPVAELGTIQNEMNRLFNNLFDQPNGAGRNGENCGWIGSKAMMRGGSFLASEAPGWRGRLLVRCVTTFPPGFRRIEWSKPIRETGKNAIKSCIGIQTFLRRAGRHESHKAPILLRRSRGAPITRDGFR